MKTYREIRMLAWDRLWKGQWFGRLFGGLLLLGLCTQMICSLVMGLIGKMGAITLFTLLDEVKMSPEGLVSIPEITHEMAFQLVNSSLLLGLLALLLTGLTAYGYAVIRLKCVDNDENRWLAESFGGYRRPLETMAIKVMSTLAVALGTLALIVPGVIAFYRYRYVWFVKVENPDWSCWKCMTESGRLVSGSKRRMFGLDCSYWAIITLGLALVMMSLMSSLAVLLPIGLCVRLVLSLLSFACLMGGLALMVVATHYLALGHAFLYREIKRGGQAAA